MLSPIWAEQPSSEKNYDKIKFAKDITIFTFEYNNKEGYNPIQQTKDNYSIVDEKISLVKKDIYPKAARNHLSKINNEKQKFDNMINNKSDYNLNSYVETDKNDDLSKKNKIK